MVAVCPTSSSRPLETPGIRLMNAEAHRLSLVGQVGYEAVATRPRKCDLSRECQDCSLVSSFHCPRWSANLQVSLQTKDWFAPVLGLEVDAYVMAPVGLSPSHKDRHAEPKVEGWRWLVRRDELPDVCPACAHQVQQPVMSLGMVRQHQGFDLRHRLRSLVFTCVYI